MGIVGSIMTERGETWVKAIKEGGVIILLAGVLYGMYVLVPDVAKMNIDAYHSLADEFKTELLEITKIQLQTAQTRQAALDTALDAIRDDEKEDRRLFVEILKRSDLTPQELQEAIEEASQPPAGIREPQ
jgi:hypothetical protein